MKKEIFDLLADEGKTEFIREVSAGQLEFLGDNYHFLLLKKIGFAVRFKVDQDGTIYDIKSLTIESAAHQYHQQERSILINQFNKWILKRQVQWIKHNDTGKSQVPVGQRRDPDAPLFFLYPTTGIGIKYFMTSAGTITSALMMPLELLVEQAGTYNVAHEAKMETSGN